MLYVCIFIFPSYIQHHDAKADPQLCGAAFVMQLDQGLFKII